MILNLSGGGGSAASLNFKVVGGTTQPASARENTIWINTDSEITGWELSPNELADPAEGLVWITTGSSATTQFNALKKNGITIYPVSAFQYIAGVWVDKPAQIFQDGSWVEWAFFLFKEGAGFAMGYTGFTNAEFTDDLITMTIKTSGNTKYSTSNEKVDVTNYKTAFFEVQKASFSGASGYSQRAYLHVGEAKAQIGEGISGSSGTFITDGIVEIDISALSGEVDVQASAMSSDEDTVTFKILIENIYFR